ncbi:MULTISPECIES: methionine ABC transporter permease [Peribacillus]|uniref:methionine ABC transporter permease n=1 Tax=Peribacillus TaxID=2675229 RepID=UPI000553CA84|nr:MULTISPECIES: methionine ABC transporter permease [Peribacillus]MBD8135862.1 ABC transporter permease [Bacillus sp. CFBP 13597]MCD1159072.1 ABC transporter permease [Peribacillus castrilensis]PEF35102.1 ABC transporter permease [Bacillus sp. AFS094228]PEO43867.1 ABC transporter permease [Bacillus sp. AFS026049]PHD78952.1 ABC transporter permease [Bacillus sp. AFS043905]PRS44818.1 ABC transporter permease [Bacillus sp. RJGP41]
MEITAEQLSTAFGDTLYMVAISLIFSGLIGLPLGILLVITRKGHILENKWIFNVLNPIINILRSVPFIILLVALIPFTRMIVGSAIGTNAAIVPLIFYAAPYIARLVENSLLEVDKGIIEAAQAMGATTWQIIYRFLIPEGLSSLILTFTTATIGLVGSTAMAGAVGAGGVGDLALAYGYQRFDTMTMIVTVAALVIIVQLLQSTGNFVSRKIRRR